MLPNTGIPRNSYIYAGNVYKFNRYGNTSSNQFNESIKQDFMNKEAYSSFVNLERMDCVYHLIMIGYFEIHCGRIPVQIVLQKLIL